MTKYQIVAGPAGFEITDVQTGKREVLGTSAAVQASQRIEVADRQAIPSLKFLSIVSQA